MRRIIRKNDLDRLQAAGGPGAKMNLADDSGRASAGDMPRVDDYLSRLYNLIPPEILAAYIAADSLIRGGAIGETLHWVIFASFCLLCIGYSKVLATTPTLGTNWRQVFVGFGAFVVLAYSMGGPFALIGGCHNPTFGGVLVILYVLAAPIMSK